jgi:homoserine kinase type II
MSHVEEAELRQVLQMNWGIEPYQMTRLVGGMNSETWEVREGSSRWVVKTVPDRDHLRFAAGLRAAQIVNAGGIPSGAPVATRAGALSVSGSGLHTALLEWVDGRKLDGSGRDVVIMGRTLGAVHGLLQTADIQGAPPFDLLDPAAPHLAVEPWVRPAMTRAVRIWEEVPGELRTWGYLHGDPAPEAFVECGDGHGSGLVDWGSCFYGPCLFDVASAVMYVGPEGEDALLESYMTTADVTDAEVQRGLLPMLRVRWAVQASYFAQRTIENDLTGVADGADNRKGLEDARRYLECH